jgi:3-oxoacyl-[acyl-carrier protein] reductase
VTETFVDTTLAGNIKIPVMLIEALVSGRRLNKNGRVIAISSFGVRTKSPPGG